jgi:hypothetical protein
MAESLKDICLLDCSPQSPRTRGGSGAAPSREGEPELRGHMMSPELSRAGSGSLSHGDTWWPPSCPELGAGDRAAGTRGSLGAALNREARAIVLN